MTVSPDTVLTEIIPPRPELAESALRMNVHQVKRLLKRQNNSQHQRPRVSPSRASTTKPAAYLDTLALHFGREAVKPIVLPPGIAVGYFPDRLASLLSFGAPPTYSRITRDVKVTPGLRLDGNYANADIATPIREHCAVGLFLQYFLKIPLGSREYHDTARIARKVIGARKDRGAVIDEIFERFHQKLPPTC